MRLTFTVPGRPVPAVRMTRRSKYVNKYARRYLAYKNQFGWIARSKYKGKPSEQPIGMKIGLFIHGGNSGDIDNYAKTVADSLNKIVYKDDKQIKFMKIHKNIVSDKADERVEVEVYEV